MKLKQILFALIIAFGIFGAPFISADPSIPEELLDSVKKEPQAENSAVQNPVHESMRGVWVASVLNLNYPTVSTPNAALLKIEADNIIESAQNAGFNAIFLQVRPTADSLYKSKIFPWSKYLTGKEGLAPANDFDPLAYFIEEAHKRNIQVHAWINPYRITKKTSAEQTITLDMLSENHPARLHPEYVVSHKGDLYFDPALPEVRNLIADGIKEIIENYRIDGIHFDDYFYPGTDFDDARSYKKYGNGKEPAQWRRQNVNLLVEQIYQLVHSYPDRKLSFGISPFGIWANAESLEGGSKTRGNQSYFAHYADSLYWIDKGIIDYIAPQIYWHIGFEIADFKVLTDWWIEHTASSKVKLYIGLAAYRADEKKAESPWYKNFELKKQLDYLKNKKEVAGFIAYSMGSVRDSNRIYNAFRGPGTIKSKDAYAVPSINLYGTAKLQYVGGLMFPSSLATINGQEIIQGSDKGFYGILMRANQQKSYLIENGGLSAGKSLHKASGWAPPFSSRNKYPKGSFQYLNDQLKNEILFAKIKEDETDLLLNENPRDGSMEQLPKGVMDEISSVHDNIARLSSNRYVPMGNIDVIYKKDEIYALNKAEYLPGEDLDKIELKGNMTPFVKAYIDGNSLCLSLSEHVKLADFKVPSGALIDSYQKENKDRRNIYRLHFEDISRLGGYYVEYADKSVSIVLKHKKRIKDDAEPLKGFLIAVDPGHGGGDSGALGLLGTSYTEKDVTLDMSLKLEKKLKKLGAEVIMTRRADEFVSLNDRLKTVYTQKPDMFLSIHANSSDLSSDFNKIRGFSVYYSKDIAKPFAKLAQYHLCMNTACQNNKMREGHFYVIRATHCPSVLLETGFMPNPEDFDWLCDDKKQDEFVSELTRSVLLYFE